MDIGNQHNLVKVIVIVIFFAKANWGDSSTWDICSPDSPVECSCPEKLTIRLIHGVECAGLGITELKDNMIVPERFQKIDFSNNELHDVHETTFNSNTIIQELDLQANVFRSIQSRSFANLPNLSIIDLSNNVISNITKESFAGMPHLTVLNLGYNKIEILQEDVFQDLISLQKLFLTYNPISQLPEKLFMSNSTLNYLDLNYMHLTELPQFLFNSTQSLEHLKLAHNRFDSAPTVALYHLKYTLRTLDLSGNDFQKLGPYSLFDLEHLEELTLEQLIHLRAIEEFAFCGLKSLKTVTIQYLPRIQYVDRLAFACPGDNNTIKRSPVQDFTFAFTIATSLPEDLLVWENVKVLNLEKNRFSCDCNFAWIKGSFVENLTEGRLYCSAPKRNRYEQVGWLTKEDFDCRPEDTVDDTWRWGTLSVLLLIGLVVSLLTVSILFYRRNGFLCRKPDNYNQLSSLSRESITVVDNNDAEIENI